MWQRDPSRVYTTGSAYKFLSNDGSGQCLPAFRDIWSKKAPLKVTSIVWKILHNGIPVKRNSERRGILSNNVSVNCVIFHFAEESANNLCFTYISTYKLWCLCYEWLGFSRVLPSSLSEHFLQHGGLR